MNMKDYLPPFLVIPVPYDKDGRGPEMDKSKKAGTEYQVWDGAERTISSHASFDEAQQAATKYHSEWMNANEEEKAPIYVNVKLKSGEIVWRTVQAADLEDAHKVAAAEEDVSQVYEASLIPGGVVT